MHVLNLKALQLWVLRFCPEC